MASFRGVVVGIVSVALIGCASRPQPLACSILGGMAGAMAGGVTAGEREGSANSNWETPAIGVGATAGGLGLGYLLCRRPSKKVVPVALTVPPPVSVAPPALPPAPPPPPPAPMPEPVVQDPCEGFVRLAGVHFDSGQAAVRPDAFEILDNVAQQLGRCSDKRLRIEAHTDSVGSDADNLELSQQRADAVLRYLVEAGVATERTQSRGYGELQPVAPNDTEDGRAENRRVELQPIE